MAKITTAQLVDELSTDTGITDEEALRKFIQKAAIRLDGRLSVLLGSSMISADENCNIVVDGDYANALHGLLLMQAECFIAKKQQFDAVSKGIRIRSGTDEVDTTAGFGGYRDVSKSACDELKDALDEFVDAVNKGSAEEYGELIWYGNQRKYEDAYHDGDYYERKHPFDSAFDDEEAQNL
jgi:hypothetical protein